MACEHDSMASMPAQQMTQEGSSPRLGGDPSSEPLTTYSRPACPADALRMLLLLPALRRTARPLLLGRPASAAGSWPT